MCDNYRSSAMAETACNIDSLGYTDSGHAGRNGTRRRRWRGVMATFFATLLANTSYTSAQTVSATPATSASSASNLSPTLGPSYAGMGIEPVHLFDYLGGRSVNQLSFNLLNNLGQYTGKPPHLRIGGNSGDNLLFSSDSEYSGFQVYSNPSASGQGNSVATDADIIGTGYFEVMNMLPNSTPITYGLNMAYSGSDYLTQIVNQAAAPLQILTNASIVGFEIGNEPDLYISNGYRTSGWTASNFGTEWATRVQAIYQSVLQPRNMRSDFFEPPTTATTATKSGQQYRISNLVSTDVAIENGIYVAGWNQHDYYYYVNVSDYTLTLPLLLDMSTLTYQLTEWRQQASQAAVTGKPYYLREMGSVGPTGLTGITDVFANTLWTLNVFLYCATLQMSAVQIHMTSNSYASPWQPIPFNGQSPHVRTTYYAFAAMAQIIGKSCTTQIATNTLNGAPSSYNNLLALYSVYQFGNLRSLVMINTKSMYTGQSAGSITFQISLPSLAGQTLYLSTLSAAGVDAMYNTTWNGLSFEQSGNGTPTTVNSTQSSVQISANGIASISVRDSSAVVAALTSRVGAETNVDTSACVAFSSTGTTQIGVTGSASTFGSGTRTSTAPTFRATGGFSSDAIVSATIVPALLLILPAVAILVLHASSLA